MKYLTKTEFKTAVGDLENLKGSRFARTLWNDWGEGRLNFIDMEPGIIYIKVMKGSSIKYMTLTDSSINREWVGIYNSTTITTLNAPMNCEIYSIPCSGPFPHQSKFPTIVTDNSGLTYWSAGRLQLNGYSHKTLKIYTYGSISPPFMNWAENPFD